MREMEMELKGEWYRFLDPGYCPGTRNIPPGHPDYEEPEMEAHLILKKNEDPADTWRSLTQEEEKCLLANHRRKMMEKFQAWAREETGDFYLDAA